jgi:hypothetical protein
MTMEPVDLELPVVVQASGLPAELEIALNRASDFARAEKAPNTRRAYTTDFAAFRAWCAGRGVSALPATAEIVAAFIGAEADRGVKASTIGRRLAAIRYAHRLAGLPSPTEVETVRAVIRAYGALSAPSRRRRPRRRTKVSSRCSPLKKWSPAKPNGWWSLKTGRAQPPRM